ncbi:flavin reductase [Roseococcus sp. YIM B11640]|uniref:flavin reductase n=1 Tax=Roseococcus sp. YIM B11640 TaxID=3133973 RepID=UPI003C7D09D8
MPVERKEFRDAMARLCAAVNIITTDGPAGRAGFTASAMCSVTDSPPTLLVCMNRNVSSCETFRKNGVLCVNTLAAGQEDLSGVFAGFTGAEGEDRFQAGSWDKLVTGAPVLDGAVVAFDARISDMVEKGTHLVVFAEIEAIRLGEGVEAALLYFARNYRSVGVAA